MCQAVERHPYPSQALHCYSHQQFLLFGWSELLIVVALPNSHHLGLLPAIRGDKINKIYGFWFELNKKNTANIIHIHTFKHLPQADLPTGPTGPQKAAQPYLLRHDNDLFPS